jgi:hypothetical protein
MGYSSDWDSLELAPEDRYRKTAASRTIPAAARPEATRTEELAEDNQCCIGEVAAQNSAAAAVVALEAAQTKAPIRN